MMGLEIRAWFVQARLLALLCLLSLACALASASPERSLRFEHLGLDQGLAQESVLNILQDRQGFMWFGSQAGLSRYDGYKITVFKNDPADQGSLADNYVTTSFEDPQGRLWFGTKGGLTRFDRATQRFVRYPPPLRAGAASSNRSVVALAADGKGGLWLGTNEGLRHFDPASGRFRLLSHDAARADSLSDNRVNALARAPDGTLWIGTGNGLNRLAPGAASFERFALAPPGSARRNHILSLSIGSDGVLWVGTFIGLEAWTMDKTGVPQRRAFGAADGVPPMRITTLYHDPDANLWVGTDLDGLKWRNPANGRFVSYRHQALDRHSLADNQVASIFLDRSGTLWAGTWYGGVNRADLASGGFNRFSHVEGDPGSLSSGKVRAMVADPQGRLWLGTTGGGLNLLDPASGSAQVLRHDPADRASLPDDLVTALEIGPRRLWVGTPSGLAWMDLATRRFTRVQLHADINAAYIQRIMIDRAGMLWVVTRGGLFRLDEGGAVKDVWRNDPDDPASLGENHGFAILEDRQGMIWVGTDNGLDRFNPASGRFTHYRHDPNDPTALRHSRIHHLYETRNGQLWVGTAGGLHRVEPGADGTLRFRFFSLNGARAADPVGAMLEDTSGMLWVSTTSGLVRLNPATGQVKMFTAKDGLIDGSYFIGSAARVPDGRLQFGGVSGVTSFRPEVIRENPFPPVVLITDFLIFNRPLRTAVPIQDARSITLSHRDSVFSLEFSALHFADPERNRFAYQLEGFDQGWVSTDAGKRFATYTNLDPGEYVFRVRASNKDGLWNEAPTTLRITILPPVWKTWWFRLAALVLVLGLVTALLRVRVRALVQQKTLLERQVGHRTAELQLQKESVERQKREVERQKDGVELAHRNISLLSEIGRKLTAKLDTESIMLMLYAHVNELMDASVFGIGVYKPERGMIDYPFAIERGHRYTPYSRSMAEPNQLAVWCITHEREVFINELEAEYKYYIDELTFTSGEEHMGELDDGSTPMPPRSLLYVPISVNGRVLGVVTVHSFRTNAYERIHLDMLRTLAAYVGVAFDNAEAYRQLKSTQAQLVAQEKLAALGSLVAGVAHELNTPIGNSLLMASTLQEKTETIAAKFEGASVRRSDLQAFIAASQEAAALIMRSLFNAAELVNSFKQVAVDQASAQRRPFNLEQATHEIVATMMNQVRKAGHTLEMRIPAHIQMDSYPGPYGQVLINLINNVLLHAFAERSGGCIGIAAGTPQAGRVEIRFHDDGCGIPAEHQARIFDPFFTTKMGQGGSGLGLNITYNIVTSLLEGSIRVESSPAHGTTFILDLPLAAG